MRTHALTNTKAISLPRAALGPAFRSLDNDVVIFAELPMYEVREEIGGMTKSSELDPEPHLYIKKTKKKVSR